MEKEEKKYGDITFRIGDKVMQIKNNYDIYWEKVLNETGSGIFNGEMGRIIEIDDNARALQVEFDDGKKAWYEYNELDQIEHSYAITIHKSQRKRIRCCYNVCATSISNATYKKSSIYRNDKSQKTFNSSGK